MANTTTEIVLVSMGFDGKVSSRNAQEETLGIQATVSHEFKCDLPGCDKFFDYNPQLKPNEAYPARVHMSLMNIVQISHPMTVGGVPPMTPPNPPKLFCCKEHAIKALDQDLHLPALPAKVVPASTDAEVKAAAAGARAVAEMKGPARGGAPYVKPS